MDRMGIDDLRELRKKQEHQMAALNSRLNELRKRRKQRMTYIGRQELERLRASWS